MIGFYLLPINTNACETKTEKSCCKKEITTSTNKKKCCEKSSDDKDCEGKCGKSTCTVSASSYVAIIPFNEEIKSINLSILLQKKSFIDIETTISSGFYSIWLPPVIS